VCDWIKDTTNQPSDVQMHEGTLRFELPNGGGDDVAALQAYSSTARTVYHPLGFTFNDFTGLILPMAALYLSGAGLDVDFLAKEKAVVKPKSAAPNMEVCVRPPGVTDEAIEAGFKVYPLADTDLKCVVETTCVQMEDEEAEQLQAGGFEQVVADVRVIRKVVAKQELGDNGMQEFDLKFTTPHMIGSYTVVARPAEQLAANQPFKFYSAVDAISGLPVPPIASMSITFGSSVRLGERPSVYFRELQHANHCARIARNQFIYKQHWCVDPQDANFSGGPDHQQIDEVTLGMKLDSRNFTPQSPTLEVLLILESRRLVKYRGGGATLRFVRL
jgi:hypothetical protein